MVLKHNQTHSEKEKKDNSNILVLLMTVVILFSFISVSVFGIGNEVPIIMIITCFCLVITTTPGTRDALIKLMTAKEKKENKKFLANCMFLWDSRELWKRVPGVHHYTKPRAITIARMDNEITTVYYLLRYSFSTTKEIVVKSLTYLIEYNPESDNVEYDLVKLSDFRRIGINGIVMKIRKEKMATGQYGSKEEPIKHVIPQVYTESIPIQQLQ